MKAIKYIYLGSDSPYQVNHISLLKPLNGQNQVVALAGVSSKPFMGVDLVPVSTALYKPQKQHTKEFLQWNIEMFSGLPGLTKVIEHDIVTETAVKVWAKPYRIPEAHRKAVLEDVHWYP